MSYGFAVYSADGKKQIDTSTWDWQYVYNLLFSEDYGEYRQGLVKTSLGGDNYTYVFNGNIIAGGITFDGQGGRPLIPAGSEMYAINILAQNNYPHMINQVFHYSDVGGFKRLEWSHLNILFYTGDADGFDSNRRYYTTINVFTR